MMGRVYLGWFIPVRKEAPRLASILLSDDLLRLLGYEPDN